MQTQKLYSESRLVEIMRDHQLRPSVQRLAVLSYVANAMKHPSAEEIYIELLTDYPTMSRTTVYNSLHALTEAGLIRELDIESGTLRYDFALQDRHSHFVCRSCGKIFDMSMPQTIDSCVTSGFKADTVDIYYKGLCPDCNNTLLTSK